VLTALGQPELATAAGVLNSLLQIASTAFQHSLPREPSVRLVQTTWRNAINEINNTKANDIFDQLVEVFRDQYGINCEDGKLPARYESQFNALRRGFREGDLLPSKESISREFITYFIRNAPDTNGDMIVGEVTVEMEFDRDRNGFSFSSGAMEDMSTQVYYGLHDNANFFGTGGVITLPTPICFKISGSGLFGGTLCEFYRGSTTSGNTNFRLLPDPTSDLSFQEQEALLQLFMDQRVYRNVTVENVLNRR